MRHIHIAIWLLILPFFLFSQNSIEEIITNNEAQNFGEILIECERYFEDKYPDLTSYQLCIGAQRDGEYVKYQRWRNFWEKRIEKDGTLADLGKYGVSYDRVENHGRTNGIFDDLEWENISYLEDLGVQIGLGRTSSLAFHPTNSEIFYVGTALGGIWKTEDGGQTYITLGDGLPFLAVSCVLVDQEDPDVLYIAVGDRVWYGPPSIGIFKSSNGGETWEPTSVEFDFSMNRRIYWLEADPNNSKIIFAGTSNGLYKTTDGFETFEIVANGSVVDVKYKPGDSNVLYYATNNPNRFYRSDDGGQNFQSIGSFPGSSYVRIATTLTNPEKVYLSINNVLYKSYDSGQSFPDQVSLSDASPGDGILMISPMNENKIYTGWFDLYKSDNNGFFLVQISDWLGNGGLPLIHVDYRNAFINPLQPQYIYLCNDGGVYRVNVSNDSFENLSEGMAVTQFYDIAVSQSNASVMSGGSQDNGNVFMEDYSWTPAAPTADGMRQAIDPLDESFKYNAIQLGAIFRYNGTSGTNISSNILGNQSGQGEWITPFLLDPNDPQTIVAGYEKVYRSNNRGNTWMELGDELAANRDLDLLTIAPSNSEKIYAIENWGINTGDLYGFGQTLTRIYAKATNSNTEWNSHVIPVSEAVEDIVVNPNDENNIFVCVSGYTDQHKVFESQDGGETWQNISENLPNAPATAIQYHNVPQPILFVGTDAGMFYKYVDETEWFEMGDFPNTYITAIEIQEEAQLIRVGTHGRGIFEADISAADPTSTKELLDDRKSCFQILPNPSKEAINIISEEIDFFVELFDGRGALILSTNKKSINVSGLIPGIYSCSIRSKKSNEILCTEQFVKK